jgi:hypothetical protein
VSDDYLKIRPAGDEKWKKVFIRFYITLSDVEKYNKFTIQLISILKELRRGLTVVIDQVLGSVL